MKISFLIIFFVIGAFFLVDAKGEEVTMNDTLKIISSRKSVRSFRNGPVSKAQIELLVKAAMAAPTAVDKRPWEFIIITDRSMLKRLADALPYAKMAAEAGAAIVVAGDLDRQWGGRGGEYWKMDCSAASENLLLAAESLGLGGVWTAVFPDEERITAVRRLLSIPDHVMPLNLIPIGIPKGDEKPKDKYEPQRIHWNGW